MAQRGRWMLPIAIISWSGLSCTPAPSLPPRADFSRSGAVLPPALSRIPLAEPPLSPGGTGGSPPSFGVAARPHPWKPGVPERPWTSIVIHHTATDHGSVEAIHESHLQKKWLGIGYHFVIGNGSGMADGVIEPTFRWREQLHGAHAGDDEYNQHGIGIALVGNFETERPSTAQLAAVKRLVGTLRAAYAIPADRVLGHSDVKATACPGRHFPLADVSRSFAPEYVARDVSRGASDRAGWRPRERPPEIASAASLIP